MTHTVSIKDFMDYVVKTVVCSCNNKRLVMVTDPAMSKNGSMFL